MTRTMHKQQTEGMAAASTAKQFAVGNTVEWTSQAAGSWTKKTGKVVAVIPPNGGRAELQKYGLSSFNSSRQHESYIVHVSTKSGRGKGTYYWPIVSKLQRVVG